MSRISRLQLYRGPLVQMAYQIRQGSPVSVSITTAGTLVLHAGPHDFITLQKWMEQEAQYLKTWMSDPEHEKEAMRQAENLRGDIPGVPE